MPSIDRDLASTILKDCFPEADAIRIISMTLEDGERHVTSDINRFIVEYEQNRVTRRKYLIMKVPTSSAILSLCDKLDIYGREINFYENVLPGINKYLDESLAPAHLFTTDSKILVVEDLAARGYKSGEKVSLLTLPETEGVMKSLAHFHAASHKLYEEDPKILENSPIPYTEEIDLRKAIHSWQMVALELLKKKRETRLIAKVEAVISFLQKDRDEIRTLLDQSKYQFVALNHGDGRKDNFLFKHTPKDGVKIQLIDFQASFMCTPAYDLIYFLTTSVSIDVIEAHLDELIDGYLYELNTKLKKLGQRIYERADFDKDFKSLRFFLLVFFFGSCAVVSPLKREQLESLVMHPEADFSYLYDLCLNDEKFVHHVYGWIKYLEKSKILDEFDCFVIEKQNKPFHNC